MYAYYFKFDVINLREQKFFFKKNQKNPHLSNILELILQISIV